MPILGSLQRALPLLGALQSREIHRRHRYLRKRRHGGYHHRQHLPLLGLPAGFHANLQGNSFANWAKVTPRQNAFIQRILNSSCHVICTMRSKQEYVLNERNGKMIPPRKWGLKPYSGIMSTTSSPSYSMST